MVVEYDLLHVFSCLSSMASLSHGFTLLSIAAVFPPLLLESCSHEIKRCLLLGRKVMTNLDSIFKSRDITLPTKVHLVKAMVFPVVMYGCKS